MSEIASQRYDYIIVGGGAMGVSTAYHLSQISSSILVLDQPFLGAASRDVNKIIRFDYTDAFYMDLAREAITEWTSNRLFQGYVHSTGRVVAYDDESQLSSIKINHELKGLSVLEDMTPSDVAQKLGRLIHCPKSSKTNATFNPLDAWVNFPECVAAMREQAKSHGVQFEEGLVEELSFDNHGRCSGVRTTDDIITCTRKVVVATGAWTEKLLGKSSPLKCQIRDGIYSPRGWNRSWLPSLSLIPTYVRQLFGISGSPSPPSRSWPVATGVSVVHFTLHGKQLEEFKRIPIFSYPGHGESAHLRLSGVIDDNLLFKGKFCPQ